MDFLEKSTMNLKEGFRYQNFLNTLMAEAETYLFSDDHLRQKPTCFQTTTCLKQQRSI